MSASGPLVSVVVASRRRPQRLARLLDALRAQTLGADAFEVIVVADGASAETHRVLTREAGRGEITLRTASHRAARGPAAARNTGWRMALAPVVAFTDDDCEPAPEWLEAGLAARAGDQVVQGITLPNPRELAGRGVFSHTVEVVTLGPQYETCNIFYPRRVLERLRGFDERYGLTPGGEDTDLAWRALDAGVCTALAPEAVVFHAVEHLGPAGTLRMAWRWTTPMRALADHAQARSMLYRGVFWNVWHYLLLRSVLVLLCPAWLRRMLLIRHLRELRARAARAGGDARHVPFLLLYDLVESAAVARGGVRYRTLVL